VAGPNYCGRGPAHVQARVVVLCDHKTGKECCIVIHLANHNQVVVHHVPVDGDRHIGAVEVGLQKMNR
jgi:hypothetical protein